MHEPIRVTTLAGDPASMGREHGERHAAAIAEYAAERIGLSVDGSWAGEPMRTEHALELAARCLPHHRRYSTELGEEMESLAEAAGISVEAALIVGGFTDFIDVVRAHTGRAVFEDTCTAVIVPNQAAADGRGLIGQTWDMHDTAMPHVVLFRIEPDSGPAALVFSTVGCLGQIGMNEAGVAVGINNLASVGKVGVTWPFVVRKALQQHTLDDAVACIVDADLAGAHNYLVMDRTGVGVDVEAMPGVVHVTRTEGAPIIHTNHCLAETTMTVEAERPEETMTWSLDRLTYAKERMGAGRGGVATIQELLKEPEPICAGVPSHKVATCGAAVMRPATLEFWALWGNPVHNEFERFEV